MGLLRWMKRARKDAPAQESPEAREAAPPEAAPPEQTERTEQYEETDAQAGEVFEADEIIAAEPPERLCDMDLADFWHDTRESQRRHQSAEADYRLIREVEEQLGYKLPGSYIELMKKHNGGLVNRCWYPVRTPAKSYTDYIQITDILGIGFDAPYSLCGRFGSRFLMEGWKHDAKLGVAICNTVKPGRALVFLDYRKCGVNGEPEVVYADSETGEEQVIARDFEAFVRGLRVSAAVYAIKNANGE